VVFGSVLTITGVIRPALKSRRPMILFCKALSYRLRYSPPQLGMVRARKRSLPRLATGLPGVVFVAWRIG
jgi:hypothetical protein